jgi:hypothetical protein
LTHFGYPTASLLIPIHRHSIGTEITHNTLTAKAITIATLLLYTKPFVMMTMEVPLAVFLQAVLEGASTYEIVVDNFRGIGQDHAKSYRPPHRQERMSDASLPALSRWGNSCSKIMDSAEGLLYHIDPECPASPPTTEPPQAPRRRSSVESSEDEWRVILDELADDDSSTSSDEEEDGMSIPLVKSVISWDTKFAALSEILPDQESLRGSLKDSLSPPRAPRRQNSLIFSDHKSLASNISLPREDQLDNDADIQRVHRRRYGIALPLTSVAQEIIRTTEEEQMDESPMFSASARQKKDSLPCCARRRPSPQLEKLASFRVIDVSSEAPVVVNRRASPQMKLDEMNCCCLAPVRAKRRPSPEEYEAFNSLVEALKETTTILEEPSTAKSLTQ